MGELWVPQSSPKAQAKMLARLELAADGNVKWQLKFPRSTAHHPTQQCHQELGVGAVHSWVCPVVSLESQLAPAGRLGRGHRLRWHWEKLLFPHRGWLFHLRAIMSELPTWGMPAWHINGRSAWVAFQSVFGCLHAFAILKMWEKWNERSNRYYFPPFCFAF